MAKITQKAWQLYIERLRKVNQAAADRMEQYLKTHPVETNEEKRQMIDYATALSDKYGEAAAAAAAQMYDEVAELSGASLPAAIPAPRPTRSEVAKVVFGTMKDSDKPSVIGSAVGRLVKQTGVDTTMQNSLRDGAEWAWIPHGDTCAFCMMLASRGWQKASKKALKNGHAEHIHNNCDCTYAIRFNKDTDVEGYSPEKYRQIFDNAEGDTWDEKLASVRHNQYEREKNQEILRIEASSPFKNPETPLKIYSYDQSKHIIGGDKYNKYMKTHEYPPSYLTISEEEAQKLVEKYHGTGILRLDTNGDVIQHEMIVDNDIVIGYAVNNINGKKVEATGFKIHYSRNGTHIVPMYESQKNHWKERRNNNGCDWLLRQKS